MKHDMTNEHIAPLGSIVWIRRPKDNKIISVIVVSWVLHIDKSIPAYYELKENEADRLTDVYCLLEVYSTKEEAEDSEPVVAAPLS